MAENVQSSELTLDDLQAELERLEDGYQKLKFDNYTRGIENPLDIRGYRRDIARVKTEIREREIAAMSEEDLAKRSKIRARRKRQKSAK
ncbi:MAG: 50S ribosomal protein L29 [Bacteroidota bacterium]